MFLFVCPAGFRRSSCKRGRFLSGLTFSWSGQWGCTCVPPPHLAPVDAGPTQDARLTSLSRRHYSSPWHWPALYTHIRPTRLIRQHSQRGFWHIWRKRKTKHRCNLREGWPTSSHKRERPAVPHAIVFQVWTERMLLFPAAHLATPTAYHGLPFTAYITVCLINAGHKVPIWFPNWDSGKQRQDIFVGNHKEKDTFFCVCVF